MPKKYANEIPGKKYKNPRTEGRIDVNDGVARPKDMPTKEDFVKKPAEPFGGPFDRRGRKLKT